MTNRSGCIPGKITYWVMLQFSQSSVHLISSGIFFIRKRENQITELVWISLKNKFQAQWRGFSLIYSLLFFSLLPSGIMLQKQQRAEEKTISVNGAVFGRTVCTFCSTHPPILSVWSIIFRIISEPKLIFKSNGKLISQSISQFVLGFITFILRHRWIILL